MDCFILAKVQVTLFLQKEGNEFDDFWKHEECLSFWKQGRFTQLFKCIQRKPLQPLAFRQESRMPPLKWPAGTEHKLANSFIGAGWRSALVQGVSAEPAGYRTQLAGSWGPRTSRAKRHPDRLWAHSFQEGSAAFFLKKLEDESFGKSVEV